MTFHRPLLRILRGSAGFSDLCKIIGIVLPSMLLYGTSSDDKFGHARSYKAKHFPEGKRQTARIYPQPCVFGGRGGGYPSGCVFTSSLQASKALSRSTE